MEAFFEDFNAMAPLGLYLLLHRHHSDTFHPYVKKKEFLWQNRRMHNAEAD